MQNIDQLPVELEPPLTNIRQAKSTKRFRCTICEREYELPTYTFPLKISYTYSWLVNILLQKFDTSQK